VERTPSIVQAGRAGRWRALGTTISEMFAEVEGEAD
jgi:hypothetical protein